MEAEITLTMDDLIALEKHVVRQHRAKKAPGKVNWWVYGALVFFFLLLFRYLDPGFVLAFAAATLGLVVLFLLLIYALVTWINRRNRIAFAADPRNAWLFQPHQLTIYRGAIVVQGKGFQTNHAWSLIGAIEQVGQYAFLFTTTRTAHIVPRRAFATEAEFLRFIELARDFKVGRQSTGITAEPPWHRLPGSTDLFDPTSSY